MDCPLVTIPDDSHVLDGINRTQINIVTSFELKRVKSVLCCFRFLPFESRTWLCLVSSLNPLSLNVTVERGRVLCFLRYPGGLAVSSLCRTSNHDWKASESSSMTF